MSENISMAHQTHPRKLEDLNLIDNFLFQQMMSQEDVGEEFAKILLGTILGKPIRHVKIISQKSIPGIDIDRHGIRLDAYIEVVADELSFSSSQSIDAQITPDIYDIEPNNSYEKKSLPKRMRYYHGLIDTQVLSAGKDYETLQNVIIIIILPYDPFDKNRVIYTIQNQCVEDSSLPYDDGARKIFLYTKGTVGNPSQELKDMLKYIEKTTVENVTNQRIETVNNLVNKVKRSKEVGINYMKSWEYEKMIREQATAIGLAQGRAQGLEQGREQGLEQGLEQGREQGLKAFLSLCHQFQMPRETALSETIQKFNLSADRAETYLNLYW